MASLNNTDAWRGDIDDVIAMSIGVEEQLTNHRPYKHNKKETLSIA
jgi:hypothetical protein